RAGAAGLGVAGFALRVLGPRHAGRRPRAPLLRRRQLLLDRVTEFVEVLFRQPCFLQDPVEVGGVLLHRLERVLGVLPVFQLQVGGLFLVVRIGVAFGGLVPGRFGDVLLLRARAFAAGAGGRVLAGVAFTLGLAFAHPRLVLVAHRRFSVGGLIALAL